MQYYVTGDSIISPGAKQGLIPLAIPLAKNSSGIDKHQLYLVEYCPRVGLQLKLL